MSLGLCITFKRIGPIDIPVLLWLQANQPDAILLPLASKVCSNWLVIQGRDFRQQKTHQP